MARSADRYQGWGDAVIFEACTAARIGEVSGCLVRDINTEEWIRTVCRQTTPSPGELEHGQTIRSAGGGRIATATLRDATSWDEVVSDLGYEHLKRHGLRHTLTWMAYGGVPLHSLRKIAGHGTLATTQRYYTPTGSPSPTPENCSPGSCGPQMVPNFDSFSRVTIASSRVRACFDSSG